MCFGIQSKSIQERTLQIRNYCGARCLLEDLILQDFGDIGRSLNFLECLCMERNWGPIIIQSGYLNYDSFVLKYNELMRVFYMVWKRKIQRVLFIFTHLVISGIEFNELRRFCCVTTSNCDEFLNVFREEFLTFSGEDTIVLGGISSKSWKVNRRLSNEYW